MNDCGCHDHPDEEHVLVMCKTHWSAMHLRSFQHGAPHDVCCDVPLLKSELRDSGRETVEAAIATMPDEDREYWSDLLGTLDFVENEMAIERDPEFPEELK